MNLFYEKGYSKTTFDEIAKRINLTKGAVYWYFRNKPDIVAALINRYVREFLEKQVVTLPKDQDLCFDDLINFVLRNSKLIQSDERVYKFVFFLSCQMEWSEAIITKISPLIEETKKYSRNVYYHCLEVLQKKGEIRKDVDIKLINEILLTMYGGALEAFLTKRSDADFDSVIKTGFNLIYEGIKKKGENK
jgi:TetR/AcrR family acrAB operon transcriptional repressor